MNRREFLHLFAATAAAAVAGLRPRPEPGEVVTRLGRGSPLWLDFEGIDAEVVARAIAAEEDREMLAGASLNQNLKGFLLGHSVEVDEPFGFLVPPEMVKDLEELAAMEIEEPA